VYKAANEQRELMEQSLADVIATPTLDLLESDVDLYYERLLFWKHELPSDKRRELTRATATRFLHTRAEQWVKILCRLSEDVADDESLRQDSRLVKELFDYAFLAAEENPDEGIQPSLDLLPFLEDQHLRDYVDRALDTLITYETAKEELKRMEPFLAMLEAPSSKLNAGDIQKAGRFARRMLGPANNPEEQERTLKFVVKLKRPELVAELQSELEQLASSENTEVAALAKKLSTLSN
jgi:hypothetical protein